MWYIAKNFYSPQEPNFELIALNSKEQVDAYLLKYIHEMTTEPPGSIPENKEFYIEMQKRYLELQVSYPNDIINQAIHLVAEEDEDWKVDIVMRIEQQGYCQWTEELYDEVKMDVKWLVYSMGKDDDDSLEFEIGIFSTDEEMVAQYYDDYTYEDEPKNVQEWVEEVLGNLDDEGSGIVAIQDLTTEIVPVWSL